MNTIIKPILKIFLFLSLWAPIFIQPNPLLTHFYSPKESYTENCKHINQLQNIWSNALWTYYYCYKKINPKKALKNIETQIKEFEAELINLEKEALIAIKNKYQINDDIWQQCCADIENLKNSYTKAMQQSHPAVTHDSTIPTDIKKTIINLLQQNGINPQAINLKMITEPNDHPTSKLIAQARSFVNIIPATCNNNFTIEYYYVPSVIEISPEILTLSTINKMSTCAHEIQHLIQHHSIVNIVLIAYLKHYYQITKEEFKKSPEYHKLSQIHEAQAEIISAAHNPEIAAYHKEKRQKIYYPDHLYEEHFCDISSIDMLWKLHAALLLIK